MSFSILAAAIPSLGGHQLTTLLVQLAVLLGAAAVLGVLARRIGLPSIVGELCAGVLLGPSILGQFAPDFFAWFLPQSSEQFHLLDAIGQLGVLLLVGLSGMELNLRVLGKQKKSVAHISLWAALIPFASGFVAGYLLPDSFVPQGDRLIFALFLAITMSVSAIPVIAKTLMDMKLLKTRFGQLSLSASTMNDIFGWVLLSVAVAMVTMGGFEVTQLAKTVLILVGFMLLSWYVVKPLLHKLLGSIRGQENGGPLVSTVVACILGYAVFAHALGFEPVLGAFICGILIGTDPAFRKLHLPTVLWVLAPLFFATAGLRIDLGALMHPTVLVVAVIILSLAVVSKFAGAYIGSRISGLRHWESMSIGAAMNARGIVEIVIANVGLRAGILNNESYTIIILVAIATSVMCAPLLRWTTAKDPAMIKRK